MAGGAGKDIYNYAADSGEFHIIRLDDVTLTLNVAGALQNQPPDAPTSPFWAQVSRGATEYGLKPRMVNICITEDPLDTGLEQGETYSIPVLDQTVYAQATLNSAVEYQGIGAKVVGKSPENIYPGI